MLLVAAASRRLADAVLSIRRVAALLVFPRRTVPTLRSRGFETTRAVSDRLVRNHALENGMGTLPGLALPTWPVSFSEFSRPRNLL